MGSNPACVTSRPYQCIGIDNKQKTRDLDLIATRENLSSLKFYSVLEIGCGTGKNTTWIVNTFKRLFAVDFSEQMMVIARQKVNAEHVNWHRMDFSLPWTIQATNFDLITFNLVLEHVEDLRHVFTEARKRLVQGGHVHVSELHPFKQYLGTKPRFEAEGGTQELDVFTHHISDFSFAATETGFDIVALNEWFDENRSEVPRLLTLLAVAR